MKTELLFNDEPEVSKELVNNLKLVWDIYLPNNNQFPLGIFSSQNPVTYALVCLRALYIFVFNKSFGQLLDISPKNLTFLKTFNSEASCI